MRSLEAEALRHGVREGRVREEADGVGLVPAARPGGISGAVSVADGADLSGRRLAKIVRFVLCF